jgi:hypothetical protein
MAAPVFDEDHFLAGLFTDVFCSGLTKPDRQRPPVRIVTHIHFGHAFKPSLIASVEYALIKKTTAPRSPFTSPAR